MEKNMWLDGMMGLVVGDALGVPVQFFEREEIRDRRSGPVTGMESGGVYTLPEGTWSDDSSMALATLDSIRRKGCIDPDDIMQRFIKWMYQGEYTPFGKSFDIGSTCEYAVEKYAKTKDWKTCGKTGEYANGNGALMRILPVCLYFLERFQLSEEHDTESVEGVHLVSGLTHNHLRSKMACGLYYFMTREMIRKSEGSLIACLQKGIDDGLRFYGKHESNLIEMAYYGRLFHLDEFAALPEDEIESSGYVVESLEAAVWSLITTDNFKDCLLKTVNLGDDTDSVAAIAGGLAGLYYGYDVIPEEWLTAIQRREWVEGLINEKQ